MDLTDLRVFVAVCEAGSMTGASRRARLALAAVSARVAALEAHLGVTLLERGARGVRVTPAGARVERVARQVLGTLDGLRDELAGAGPVRGTVRLWASTMAVAEHLPPALGPLLAAWPELTVRLEEHPSPAVLQALDEGRADVGVVSGVRVPRGWLDLPFRRDHLVAVVPVAHALAGAGSVAFEALLDAPFVGLDADAGIQRFLEAEAERGGRRLNVVVRVRAFDGVCRLVACGAGVAVVPAASAARLQPADVVVLPLRDAWAERTLRVCAPSGPRGAAARVVIEGLVGSAPPTS